jgi:uncharacterized protein YkwD
MGIRFFRGERTRYEHEYRQLEEIVGILKKEYLREPVYVLTNVLVANGQLDCVLLTRNGPLILELKAFNGEVRGLENGNWEITTAEGPIPLPNLFLQARNQRQDFIDRLIPIYRGDLSHVSENNLRKMSSWLYFCRGSRYPEGQIDFRKVKWFRVVTADTLLEKMRFLDTGYTLRLQDMDAIVRGLHLQEYNFDSDRPVSSAPVPAQPRFRLSRGTIAILVILIFLIGIAVAILIVPGAMLAVSALIQAIGAMIAGIVQTGSRDLIKSGSDASDSQAAVIYLNQIRVASGTSPLTFDERAFQLALTRAADMAAFQYLEYTNPETGSSAATLKSEFGIGSDETVVESDYGQWNGYAFGIEKLAVDAWTSDYGNRKRLFGTYDGAAIACSGGYCSFIGIVREPVDLTLEEISSIPVENAGPGRESLTDS